MVSLPPTLFIASFSRMDYDMYDFYCVNPVLVSFGFLFFSEIIEFIYFEKVFSIIFQIVFVLHPHTHVLQLQLNISSGLLPFFHRSLEKFLFCFYFYFLNFVFILFCFCFSLLFRVIVSVAMVQGHWSFLLKCLSFYWFHAVTFLFSISPMSLMSIFILFVNGCFKVLVI